MPWCIGGRSHWKALPGPQTADPEPEASSQGPFTWRGKLLPVEAGSFSQGRPARRASESANLPIERIWWRPPAGMGCEGGKAVFLDGDHRPPPRWQGQTQDHPRRSVYRIADRESARSWKAKSSSRDGAGHVPGAAHRHRSHRHLDRGAKRLGRTLCRSSRPTFRCRSSSRRRTSPVVCCRFAA